MKWSLLLTAGVLTLALLAGCGSQEAPPAEAETEEAAVTETEEAEDAQETTEGEEEAPAGDGTVTVEEAVFYDADGITLTVTGADPDYEEGPAFLMTFDNQTDKNLYITVENACLNGYQMPAHVNDLEGSFYSGRINMDPGTTLEGLLSFDAEGVEAAGVTAMCQGDFSLKLEDYDTFDEIAVTDLFHVDTSLAGQEGGGVTPADGKVVYEDENLLIAAMGTPAVTEDDVMKVVFPVQLYLENKSGEEFDFMVTDAFVNGGSASFASILDDSWVLPGKKAVTSVMLRQEELDTAGIASVDRLSLAFLVDGDEITVSVDPVEVLP